MENAGNEGLCLALVGPAIDSLRESSVREQPAADKPCLYVVTSLPSESHNTHEDVDRLFKAVKGEEMRFDVSKGLEKAFPNFFLNLGGLLNHGGFIQFPHDQLEGWMRGEIEVLFYDAPGIIQTKAEILEHPYGYGRLSVTLGKGQRLLFSYDHF